MNRYPTSRLGSFQVCLSPTEHANSLACQTLLDPRQPPECGRARVRLRLGTDERYWAVGTLDKGPSLGNVKHHNELTYD
jgi:hypothetical protein